MGNGSRSFQVEVANVNDSGNRDQQVRVAFEQCHAAERMPEADLIDHWLPAIAPSSTLLDWFNYDEEKWHEFERRYRRELRNVPTQCERLRELAFTTTLTLIYMNGSARRNAAIVLKKHLIELECQRRWNVGWMVGGHTSPVRNEIEQCGGLWFGWHKAWMMPDRESCDYIRSLLPGDF